MKDFLKKVKLFYESLITKINNVIFFIRKNSGILARKIDKLYTPEQGYKMHVIFRFLFKITTWVIFPIVLISFAIAFTAPLINQANDAALTSDILLSANEAFIGLGVIWAFIFIFGFLWFWFSKYQKNTNTNDNKAEEKIIEKNKERIKVSEESSNE